MDLQEQQILPFNLILVEEARSPPMANCSPDVLLFFAQTLTFL
jgi:hypothetical protein